METASLVLNAISTLAAVVSAIAAIGAKNEVKKLKNSINGNNNTQFGFNLQANHDTKEIKTPGATTPGAFSYPIIP